MTAPYDPNWYLSTVVQSSAALIAIIGGFLVSRLVSLTAQRSEFVQKKSNLNNRRKASLQELSANKALPTNNETDEAKKQKKQEVEHAVKFLDDELSALKRMDEIKPGIIAIVKGFGALLYFGLVGIIYPLFLMTRHPVIINALGRDIVFFGFVSGFIALLIFIIDLLWNLR